MRSIKKFDLAAGWPGRFHGARVFANSSICDQGKVGTPFPQQSRSIGHLKIDRSYKGTIQRQEMLITRILPIKSDNSLPFQFRHLQFPVRLCFAMTINKSEGETFSGGPRPQHPSIHQRNDLRRLPTRWNREIAHSACSCEQNIKYCVEGGSEITQFCHYFDDHLQWSPTNSIFVCLSVLLPGL